MIGIQNFNGHIYIHSVISIARCIECVNNNITSHYSQKNQVDITLPFKRKIFYSAIQFAVGYQASRKRNRTYNHCNNDNENMQMAH